jgi:hypothetical protein
MKIEFWEAIDGKAFGSSGRRYDGNSRNEWRAG